MEDRKDLSRELGEKVRTWSDDFADRETLSLADCFRLALARSETLLLQGERLFETWTYEREAISSLLPSVGIHAQWSRDSDSVKFGGVTVSPRSASEYWISVQQKVFDGQALAAVPAAREAARIERLNLNDARDRLLYSVAAGFYQILGYTYDVQVFEASLASAEEFYRVVEARRASGEASRQESLSAEAQRDQAAASLIEAQHNLKVARADLARIVGLDFLPPKLEDTYEVTLSPGHIPDLVVQARANRSDVEAAKAGIELAKAERLAVFSDYLPLVTADFTRWLKREGAFASDIDWNLSLNASWSLFDSGAREARQARALSTIRQREYELSALERQVRYEVEEAVLAFDSLGRVLGALKSREKASQGALDLAEAEYRASEATNLDVMISRRAWEEAARDLSRAELARKLAALKIRLVVGDFELTEPLREALDEVGG
jgi:outer membrane protein TolC